MTRSASAWQLGLGLAASTALLWSTLPIAAKIALQGLDPYTLTWVRFAVAGLVTLGWVGARGQLPALRAVSWQTWVWLILAAVTLLGNYLLYLVGLELTTPANAQVLIQTAPLMMGLGGIVVFRERLAPVQWLGVAVLLASMGLFFADQLVALFSTASTYIAGAGVILAAAASWAGYALVQKHLSGRIHTQLILLVIYLAGTVLLAPIADVSAIFALDSEAAWAVAYCCFNTVAAYGAFAAAVSRWESSRVSAVLTLTPLGTLVLVTLIGAFGLSWVAPESVSVWGWLGAAGVVAGSMSVSLGGRRSAA